MTESLITISIIGLLAGFVFSMPVAGPISFLIVSNALQGKLRNCNLLAVGASVADFIYVFIAVYGISHFITEYRFVIPYVLGAGSIFVFVVGIRIAKSRFDLNQIEEEGAIQDEKVKKKSGALYTGFMVNILNPTLFFGWLISSFILLSFAASLGFDTGGLNKVLDNSLSEVEKVEGARAERPEVPSYLQFDTLSIFRKENHKIEPVIQPKNFHLLVSLSYSFFVAAGSVIWFIIMTLFFVRFRKRINIKIVNYLLSGMGLVLCCFAIYFAWQAVRMIMG